MKKPLVNSIIAFSLCIIVQTGSAIGQKSSGPKYFDLADFSKKFEAVQWLVEYDEVAWKTSDVAMAEDKAEVAKLGREWFCFQDAKGLWHAVYGRLEDDKFVTVFHYTFERPSKIARSTDKLDQPFLDASARALNVARSKLVSALPEGSPLFNQYIKKNADGTMTVWMLPAFQTDNTAVYGGEAIYQIDSTGKRILKEETYFQPTLRGFKTAPPREVLVDYKELEKPSLMGIFFVWYYKSYFTKIFLETKNMTSTVIEAGGQYTWLHVEKDPKKR